MAWQLTTYTVLGLVAAGVSAAVAVLAWNDRGEPGARPFTALMVALGSWSFVYAVQIGFTTRATQLPLQRVALAIGGTIPTLWFLFTLRYARKDDWLTRRWLALLAVDPIAFGLLTLTNDVHGLVWNTATLDPGGPPVVTISLALGYYVHILYGYVIITAGLVLLALVSWETPSLYRRQTVLLIFGTLPPFFGNIAFTLGVVWGPLPALDPTPFAFVVTGLLFGLALYRFDLLDRTPVARRLAFEEMGDGLVVLDADGSVVDTNRVADRLLENGTATGQHASAVVPGFEGDTLDEDGLGAVHGTTVTTTVEGRQRVYDVQTAALTDTREETTGGVISYRDVTARKGYEQRLEVAQRVLRHNLRNDMNIIRGMAEILEERADGYDEEARRIVETADRLIDLSEKTRTMVSMGEVVDGEPRPIDVSEPLRAVVAEHRQAHPAARIDTDIEPVVVELPDSKLLRIAVGNLIENAIEHNDRAEPWVRVSATTASDSLVVRVTDDGPGIPALERDVLREGKETPLQHGRGIGLWLAYWCVTAVGGTIEFGERDGRGSVVSLRVPLPGPDG